MIVGGKYAVPEGCLMQPVLDQAQGVAALDHVRCCGRGSGTRELAERDLRGQSTTVPVHGEKSG